MLWPWSDPERRRRKLLAAAEPGPYREYLAKPLPDPKTDFRQTDFLALDLETTGLDPQKDQILSVGMLVLRAGSWIDLGSAHHRLVRPKGGIPEESAVIHRITDDRAASGGRLDAVMVELLAELGGRVLLAHHARVEYLFLDQACRRLYGQGLVVRVTDTQVLARRSLDRGNQSYGGRDLRLSSLRSRFRLPRYPAHNALSDALAAAELFLALTARHDPRHRVPLKQLTVRI